MDPVTLAEAILLAIVDALGTGPLAKVLAAKTPQAEAQAMLDAEYVAARASADAAAAAMLGKDSP
jgi:hypothetical protein